MFCRYIRGVTPISFLNRREKFSGGMPTAVEMVATGKAVLRSNVHAFLMRREAR